MSQEIIKHAKIIADASKRLEELKKAMLDAQIKQKSTDDCEIKSVYSNLIIDIHSKISLWHEKLEDSIDMIKQIC